VHHPRLLLADEPFTGLDRSGVELLGRLLAEERARGTMLLVVTHDFDAVAEVVDRVLVLHKGKLVLDEPTPADRNLAALYRRVVRS
jgi:ABC-type multidrug transport system ATPase subunit